MTNETLERQVIDLIATDRLHIPISSMEGKLKRRKPKLAEAVSIPRGTSFNGERVYAKVTYQPNVTMKSRTIAQAIAKYCEEHPAEGAILTQYIEDERAGSETYLHFGVQEGRRLTADDYLGVMRDLGFSEGVSRNLYPELMEVSRRIQEKRKQSGTEERSILIGSTFPD